MVALFTKPIDMIFDLLTSPVADDMKITKNDNLISSVVHRMSNVARRVSTVASNTTNLALNNISSTKRMFVGLTTRKIPQTTETAHQLATASMSVLSSTTIKQLQEIHLTRMRTYYNNLNGTSDLHVSDDSDSDDDDSSESDDNSESFLDEDEIRKVARVDKIANSSFDNDNNGNVIEKLTREIACQRKLLKASEMEIFDQQWGIDPTGEFAAGDKSLIPCMKHKEGAYDIISQQLSFVDEEVMKKSEKLIIATDAHTGLEILHLLSKIY